LSRKNFPKQFEKIIGEKSTLQLAIERLQPEVKSQDIYIATNKTYVPLIHKFFPQIPEENVIGEPELKDVGPAVGIVVALLNRKFSNIPMVILWSDHIVRRDKIFKNILHTASKVVNNEKRKIVFIGQKPRYASQNLGWIKYGKTVKIVNGIELKSFSGFHYRPSIVKAKGYYRDGNYTWNLGYFVTTPGNLWKLYEKFQPEIFSGMKKLYSVPDYRSYETVLNKIYSQFPKISFDNAILESINSKNAYVVSDDLGWSDVGAWEALKEALQNSPEENVIKGKVLVKDCVDTLVYNYENKLVVTIDLNGHIVINTHDVILVCHKNSVPKIKNLVEHLANTENQNLA
jgi:mannose-1-phosphate guanylyltransferase